MWFYNNSIISRKNYYLLLACGLLQFLSVLNKKKQTSKRRKIFNFSLFFEREGGNTLLFTHILHPQTLLAHELRTTKT